MDLALASIFNLVAKKTGLKLEMYRESYLRRRIELRMRIAGFSSFEEYYRFLKSNENEINELLNTIAINVTEFMRDVTPFKFFVENIIPELSTKTKTLRFWSAGCASGEEAYSIAILASEANVDFSIYATDVDEDAIQKAKAGCYEAKQLKNLSPKLLENYFEQKDRKYYVKSFLKHKIKFKRHDLTSEPPISKHFDAIFCRNVMIYFNEAQKAKILNDFWHALKPWGYLIIGKCESLNTNIFECVNLVEKIYRKRQYF